MKIKGIHVDLKAIYSISHRCDPAVCRQRRSCCATYEVCVEKEEISRLDSFTPLAAHYSKNLKDGEGFRNVFEKVEKNLAQR